MSLRHSHQLKHVTVWIVEVNASAAIPIIEFAVVEAPGSAADESATAAQLLSKRCNCGHPPITPHYGTDRDRVQAGVSVWGE
jgi:hypothetical protein